MDGAVEVLHTVVQTTVTVMAKIPASNPSVAVLGANRLGSGVVVDPAGLVLTVNYVILGASDVALVDVEGRRHEATVIAQDFATGIGLLRMETAALPAIEEGNSHKVSRGDDVFVIASAGSEERRSACGIVSSLEPFDAYWEYRLERAVWTTATNPGLGGSPLCNARGELVAIVSLNLGNVGRSTLAIPAEYYYSYAEELLSNGRRVSRPPRAWIGMFCYGFPDRTVVAGLIPEGPGEVCGLHVGDVIVRVDGEEINGRTQLYERIWAHRPGEFVDFHVLREEEPATVRVESGDVEEFFS